MVLKSHYFENYYVFLLQKKTSYVNLFAELTKEIAAMTQNQDKDVTEAVGFVFLVIQWIRVFLWEGIKYLK